ncbi:hypothetical protein [Peribacillus sp. TH27]|uniref:hypothetical protein n=1 Tax=Peribacillus sp. TH27 TaxID=2798484 RepID=UPI0019147232|nr:hypothetical protein [Peribacillus sp. TH27]MBK5463457.1 hypothetical protein [Peribacillus sp. TH27]
MATPQQIQQNVQKILTNARLPHEARQTVQRVMDDVHKQRGIAPETVKTKVIQELEKVSFGAKEPIKQLILQDAQKAFTATPEQVQQNIKQIVETTNDVKTATTLQPKREEKSGYFGTLFGEKVNEYESKSTERKDTRFGFIKIYKIQKLSGIVDYISIDIPILDYIFRDI